MRRFFKLKRGLFWSIFICIFYKGTKLLKSFNVAKGKRITTFPKYREDLEHGYQIQDKNVEIDENLITSQGPATAFDFAFSIVGQLFGAEKMNQVAEQIGFNSVIKREQ